MFENLKPLVHNLMVSLEDRYQKSHEQWQTGQRIIQKQQADIINFNIQLQLQYELFTILNEASAPKFLRSLANPVDLLIAGYSINRTGQPEFYFKWEKTDSYLQPLYPQRLSDIMEKLNIIIQTYRTRLENQCVYDCALYEHLVTNYPLTVKGFAITNCCNDIRNPQNYICLTVTVNP